MAVTTATSDVGGTIPLSTLEHLAGGTVPTRETSNSEAVVPTATSERGTVPPRNLLTRKNEATVIKKELKRGTVQTKMNRVVQEGASTATLGNGRGTVPHNVRKASWQLPDKSKSRGMLRSQTSQTRINMLEESFGELPGGGEGDSTTEESVPAKSRYAAPKDDIGCQNFVENIGKGEFVTKSEENPKSRIANLRMFWEKRDLSETAKPNLCGPNGSGTVPSTFVTTNHKKRPG